jgi:hypothetical protein
MEMTRSNMAIGMILPVLLLAVQQAAAFQPTRFTFTPTFKDPDPGMRHWERTGTGYVERLPSGRVNTFRVYKDGGTVNGLKGTILEKVEESNFFVFVADSEAARKELWWSRNGAPWAFMGVMKNISAPVRID